MNKNMISKIIVLIVTFVLIACVSTSVFADNALDLSDSLTGGSNTTENTTTDNTTTEDDSTTDEEIPDISPQQPTETTPEETTPEETTPDITPNTTTSTYEESNIPHAGVESSILMASAFIVCAIIGIYTFMKMSDYSNI